MRPIPRWVGSAAILLSTALCLLATAGWVTDPYLYLGSNGSPYSIRLGIDRRTAGVALVHALPYEQAPPKPREWQSLPGTTWIYHVTRFKVDFKVFSVDRADVVGNSGYSRNTTIESPLAAIAAVNAWPLAWFVWEWRRRRRSRRGFPVTQRDADATG